MGRVAFFGVELARAVEIEKRFGDHVAVRGASIGFEAGRIHAVIGENGAGKSTLLKIVAGVLEPNDGHVVIAGDALAPHTAREAIRRGVGMVQQHFALVGVFTALENVVLGGEPVRSFGRIDWSVAREKLGAIARELGMPIALDTKAEAMGVGDRQRLEIARALYRDARVLILDEPTAVLTPDEATALYATARRLANAGRAVVVVTHKLDEVRSYADDVTVMRKGEVILSRAVRRDSLDDEMRAFAEAAMGTDVAESARARSPRRDGGEVILTIRDLKVCAGEIVGVAGIEGNGQRGLVEALARRPDVAVVHEDRQREGLVLDASIADNVILGELAQFSRGGLLDARAMDRDVEARLARADASFDHDATARSLSGGNQQKIVIARALAHFARGARALVLAHPTRGVDLAATRSIHRAILAAAADGAAVLVTSSDLAELRALSDRIVVIARGKFVREFSPDASDREIGRAMLDAPDFEVA